MDAATLREIQRPLKDQYRADPDRAVVTLRAEGSLADSEVACSVQTGRALVEAGLHPATGGDGTLACSGDMLLEARGIPVHMALDHRVSQRLYVSDPDGNLIEPYVDADEQIWRSDPSLVANSEPLTL